MMKNKILLGSVTLLSALMVAAWRNGEKKTAEPAAAIQQLKSLKETTAAPTTTTQTTTAKTTTPGTSSETKKVSLEDTKRVGKDNIGYVNVPKDWVVFKASNNPDNFYSSPDQYNIMYLESYSKDKVKLNDGETFYAELIANRLLNGVKMIKNKLVFKA